MRHPSRSEAHPTARLHREGRSERYAARDGNRGPRVQKLRILVEQESFGSQTIRLEHEVSIGADAQPEDFAEVEEYIRQRRGSGSSVIAAVFNTVRGLAAPPPPSASLVMKPPPPPKVNLFMGVALLSIVYAVAQGGFMSFVPLVLAGCLMCLSGPPSPSSPRPPPPRVLTPLTLSGLAGSLLGSCMEEFPATSRPSYPDIATRAWGQGGRSAAVIFCFLELYGNSCMNLIVLWQECESLLSSKHGIFGLSPRDTAVLLGSLAILPFFLMGNLETLSYLSFVSAPCCPGKPVQESRSRSSAQYTQIRSPLTALHNPHN